MTSKAKIAILSSVEPDIFKDALNRKNFTQKERNALSLDEIEVWRNTLKCEYLQKNTQFEVINALKGLPKNGEYDGYILGGSPALVTDRLEWTKNLEKFIHKEVNAGVPTLGVCFGHQVLASAFGGKVDFAHRRKTGVGEVYLNTSGQADKIFGKLNKNFQSLWSHRQFVVDTGEAESLGENLHTPNQIIRIGEHAWGVQFHPDFSKEFCSFLAKLMQDDLEKSGEDIDLILQELESFSKNDGTQVVSFFVESILK